MKIVPLRTKVEQVVEVSDGVLVLEDYSAYPQGESNFYKLSRAGEVVWKAEVRNYDPRIGGTDHYVGWVKLLPDGNISCTAGLFEYVLDSATGKIVKETPVR